MRATPLFGTFPCLLRPDGKCCLIDKEKLAKVKLATVAIGLAPKNETLPRVVCGTGFFFNSEGYVMTAAHVVHTYVKLQKFLKEEKGEETVYAVFQVIPQDNGDSLFMKYGAVEASEINITDQLADAKTIPDNVDI